MSKNSIVVQTESGAVVGYRSRSGISQFRGIPYAAAPVGDRRFRPPQPTERWDGHRDATVSGPTSPQHEPAFRGAGFNYRAVFSPGWIRGDEFLNLNVWTPDASRRDMPVMVWIHGGAFNHGNGAVPIYDGTRFAEDGVVYVSINYRLGFEGFLWLEDGEPNLGIQDQIAALEWVQRNIGRFGGDPGNVTIFGESAGAASVNLLLTAPAARGLFSRAISQSGLAPDAPSEDDARATAERLAAFAGVPATRAGLGGLEPARLLALGEEYATRAGDPFTSSEGPMLARPWGDGTVLPASVGDAFRAGSAEGVPVIWGFNSDEANLFTVPNGVYERVTDEDVRAFAADLHPEPELLIEHASRGLDAGHTPGDVRNRLQTWAMFAAGTVEAASVHSGRGEEAWLYEFAWRSPQLDGTIGAAHLVEIPFVFDSLDAPNISGMIGDAPPRALASEMHSAWVRFAQSGDPGWPRYDGASASVHVFDAVSRTEQGRFEEARELWSRRR